MPLEITVRPQHSVDQNELVAFEHAVEDGVRYLGEAAIGPAVDRCLGEPVRRLVEEVHVHPDVQQYIIDLVTRIRNHPQVVIGASPRGSLALLKLTRAWAAIQGRGFVTPDDVKLFAQQALSHRIIMEPSLWGSKTTERTVIDDILRSVATPVTPIADE